MYRGQNALQPPTPSFNPPGFVQINDVPFFFRFPPLRMHLPLAFYVQERSEELRIDFTTETYERAFEFAKKVLLELREDYVIGEWAKKRGEALSTTVQFDVFAGGLLEQWEQSGVGGDRIALTVSNNNANHRVAEVVTAKNLPKSCLEYF